MPLRVDHRSVFNQVDVVRLSKTQYITAAIQPIVSICAILQTDIFAKQIYKRQETSYYYDGFCSTKLSVIVIYIYSIVLREFILHRSITFC